MSIRPTGLTLCLLLLLPAACGGDAPAPPPDAGTPPANVPPTTDTLPKLDVPPPPSIPDPETASNDPKDYPDLKIEVLKRVEAADAPVLALGQVAKVHYTGTQRNGREFDSSWKRGTQPADFDLAAVVPGFRIGLVGMKVGERRRLTVPGKLAYGAGGNPGAGIGPNETLIFDVELVGITDPAAGR